LRALAITAEERVEGIDVPTLKEQGVDVALVNWRGVFAAPGIRKNDMQALSSAIEQMAKSPQWQDVLEKRTWIDMYMPAEEFAAFLKEDTAKVTATLTELGMVK
jgi:putative tricarboxylic transport membrane protein